MSDLGLHSPREPDRTRSAKRDGLKVRTDRLDREGHEKDLEENPVEGYGWSSLPRLPFNARNEVQGGGYRHLSPTNRTRLTGRGKRAHTQVGPETRRHQVEDGPSRSRPPVPRGTSVHPLHTRARNEIESSLGISQETSLS